MWSEFFEGLMFVCFGFSWPFAIAKSWRCRLAHGKSPLFLVIILIGYLSGICSHFWRVFSPVVFLYTVNATMVAIDLYLVMHFRRHPGKLPLIDRLDGFFKYRAKGSACHDTRLRTDRSPRRRNSDIQCQQQ